MFPTIFLVSDRAAFEDAWRAALVEVGMEARVIDPDALPDHVGEGCALVIDAASAVYDEDEILAAVGFARARQSITAISLPEGRALAGIEDLLEDLCSGLVVRSPSDVRRVAGLIARRRDHARGRRFEYLTVSTRPYELLAVMGDGTALLLPRPVSAEYDGSDVASIMLESDAHSATLKLGSGRELTLQASVIAAKSSPQKATGGMNGTIAIDGAHLGARLRELRLAAGLTQAELARRTGIHRPNIARVEAGRHTPSLETLARLASAIGVPTTHVLSEK